jgi:hypothetical protein
MFGGRWGSYGEVGFEGVDAQATGGYAITYYDQLTPGAMTIDIMLDESVISVANEAAGVMADEIREIYDEGGRPTWDPVVDWWLKRKKELGWDLRTMHMSGDLETNVHNLKWSLRSYYEPKTGVFVIEGLDEAFDGTEYVWIHELLGVGKSRIRRPFIFQGMMKTLQAMVVVEEFLLRTSAVMAERVPPMRIKLTPTAVPIESQYAIHKTRFHTSFISLLWWVLPPTRLLAIYGAAMDVLGVTSGKLLEARFIGMWVTAYLKGILAARMGLIATEKQGRRLARRTIYRGR